MTQEALLLKQEKDIPPMEESTRSCCRKVDFPIDISDDSPINQH